MKMKQNTGNFWRTGHQYKTSTERAVKGSASSKKNTAKNWIEKVKKMARNGDGTMKMGETFFTP